MGLFDRTSVGLEVDSYEARFVEFSGSPSSPRIIKYGNIALPEGAVREGIIQDPDKVAAALSELWNRYKIKCRDVLIGVSNQDVLVRFATFPKVPKDKLDNLIRFQAQDFLPMPVNTVVLDYMVIDDTMGNDGNSIEVLLVAARRTMVEGFLKSLEIADLRAKDMDVTSLALWRLIPVNEVKGSIAVINLGNEAGNILLMQNGAPRLARHISVNLRSFVETSASIKSRSLNIDQLLDKLSDDETDDFIGIFTDVIQSSINYYYVQSNAEAIRKVLLCGYGGRVRSLMESLHSAIDIPVELSDPLNKFNVMNSKVSMDTITASEYAISMSLAFRGLGG